MKALKKISDMILGKPQEQRPVRKIFSVGPEDYRTIPKAYQKEKGILKARYDRLAEAYQSSQREVEELKKALQEITQERTMSAPFITKREQISMAMLFLAMMDRKRAGKLLLDRPAVLKVVTREHRYLGVLDDIWLEVVGNKMLWKIVVRNNGKLKVAMKGFSFKEMIHRPVGLIDALNTGVLVLNRTYDGKFVPDVEWIEYGGEAKDIEDMMADMEEKISSLQSEVVEARSNEEEERTRRKLDNVSAQAEKARADALADSVTGSLEKIREMMSAFGKAMQQAGEASTSAGILRQKIEKMESVVEEVQDKLEKKLPQDRVEHATENLKEIAEFLAGLKADLKGDSEKERKKK